MSSTSESNGSLKIPICQESMANESQTQDPHLVCDEDAQEMDSSDIGGPVANPEMPQEMVGQDLEDADTIKDTVFSKHWAISVLLEFVRYVENKKLHELPELEEAFHDNLCKLWDISISEGVSIFLLENEYLDLFSACIERSACPRAIEISVGILANMSCVDLVSEAIEKDLQIMKIAVCLLQSSYPPVLVETSRLLTTCISRSKSVQKWMDEIKESPEVFGCILFILNSSTNSQLLEGIAEFIDGVLGADDGLCQNWSTPEFVAATMEALIQLGPNIGESGKTFLHILQCVSTSESGVKALAMHAEKACKFSISYLKSISDEDFIVLDDKETSIASALAVLNAAFCHWEGRKEFVSHEYTLIRCILKLIEVSSKMGKYKNDNIGDMCNASDSLSCYINELLVSLLQDTLSTLLQVALDSLRLEKGITIPKSLEYLETTCDSNRLTFFLKSSTNHHLWLDIARAFKCIRLIDCLTSEMESLKIH